MADQVLQRSNSKGSRRGGRQNRNGAGPKHFADLKGHLGPAGGMPYHAQNGSFGRDFEPHHEAAGEEVQEMHLNGDAHTPHSESSESDRIAAYPSTTAIPTTTAGLQSLLVGIRGDIGRLREVEAQVSAVLKERSEVERLELCLQEERQRRAAAEQNRDLVRGDNERLQQALGLAQQNLHDREEQHSRAEAALATRLATAEAGAQASQQEIAALQTADAERQRAVDERVAAAAAEAANWHKAAMAWQAKAQENEKQAWHADNEFAKMDAHYRRQLEGLVAEKRSADEELAVLRAAIGGQHPAAAGAPVGGQHPAAAGAGGAAPGQGVRAVANAGQKGASGAAAAASSGSGGTSPATRPPEDLLDDQAMVDLFLGLVPQGKANAKAFTATDFRQLEAVIGRGAWDRLYASKYGSALDFLRAHPEAFYLGGDSGNLFYRPEAPARLPQPSAWPAPPPAASMPAHPLPVPGSKAAPAQAMPARATAAPLGGQQPIVAIITPAAPPGLHAKRAALAKAAGAPPKQAPPAVQGSAAARHQATSSPAADAQATLGQQAAVAASSPKAVPSAEAPAPAAAPAGQGAKEGAGGATKKKRHRKKGANKGGQQ